MYRELGAGRLGDFGQELVVGTEGLQAIHQHFQAWSGVSVLGKATEYAAQFPDQLELLALEQQFFVTYRRLPKFTTKYSLQPTLFIVNLRLT